MREREKIRCESEDKGTKSLQGEREKTGRGGEEREVWRAVERGMAGQEGLCLKQKEQDSVDKRTGGVCVCVCVCVW